MASSQLVIDGSSFSWPTFPTPSTPTFTSDSLSDFLNKAVTWIFSNVLQRAPTSAEITTYGQEIQDHYQGMSGNTAIYDYGPATNDVAHLQETTDKLQSAFMTLVGSTASSDIIGSGENDLGTGITFQQLRDAIFSSNAESNAVSQMFEQVYGRAGSSDEQSAALSQIGSGSSIHDVRWTAAHSSEVSTDIQFYWQAILGGSPGNDTISATEDNIGNGSSLAEQRATIAYSQEAHGDIVAYWQAILGRDPTDDTIAATQANLANGSSMAEQRSAVAYSQEARNDIVAYWQAILNGTPGEDTISATQANLANGSSMAEQRATVAYSQEAQNDIVAFWQAILNRAPGDDTISADENALATGSSMADLRSSVAYSDEAQADIGTIYQQVLGHAVGTVDAPTVSAFEAQLASGAGMSDVRSSIAHSGEAEARIDGIYQFHLERSADTDGTTAWADSLASGTTLQDVSLAIAQSAESQSHIAVAYTSYGQESPDSGQLTIAETAMYNLWSAWQVEAGQDATQLQSSAATYTAISGSASFQDVIAQIGTSYTETLALVANMLVDPMMNDASTSAQVNTTMSSGGEEVLMIAFDEADVLNNLAALEKDDDDIQGCSNPAVFKAAHSTDVDNAAIAAVPSNSGSGVQWGGGISAQGLPYERWVAQQLSAFGTTDLSQYKGNWKAFDQWNAFTGDGVSDKTLNLQAPSYTANANAVTARVVANIQQMIRYESDSGTDNSSGVLFSIRKDEITSYTLFLGVPSEPTDAQWQAICRAYQIGTVLTAADPNGARSLTLNVSDIFG